MCNKLGGRLATYDELKNAVSDNLIIDNDKPAMVLDSDSTYVSKNSSGTSLKKLVIKAANETSSLYSTSKKYDTQETISAKGYDQINMGLDWPERCWSTANTVGAVDNGICTSAIYYDLDGYVKTIPFTTSTLNLANTSIADHFYYDKYGARRFKRTPAATETYGHPVCIAPTAPPGNTLDVTFPTRTGMGWVQYNDIPEIIAGSSFTKRYNIRKQGDTAVFNKSCPISDTSTAGSTITLVSMTAPPSVSVTTTPTTPQTSYNILNMDAVYTQVDIAAVDLPIRRDAVIADETANIGRGTISETVADTDLNPSATNNEGGRRVRNAYASLIKEAKASTTTARNLMIDFSDTISTYFLYYQPQSAIINALQSGNMTTTQFSNMLLKNIDDYYNALSLNILLHPVAFLRKGVINFPSFLNTFKIYNLPDPNAADLKLEGWISTKQWEIKTGEPNHFGLKCVDGTSDKYYQKGMYTNQTYHSIDGWWCHHNENIDGWTASCRNGTTYLAWAFKCVKEYYQVRTEITDAHYMIGSQAIQQTYDIYSPNKYKTVIDANWTPVGDPGNPILANLAAVNIRRSIPVIGTITPLNITKIEGSISLAICLNFMDTSNIQSQICISSDDCKLYMSPDASGKPEYSTKFESGQVYLTPANAPYNRIHCPIEITSERFFLLPFHTRSLISQWAIARYNRIKATSTGTAACNTYTVPAFLTPPCSGTFFSTTTSEARNQFLDNVAKFYYENERSTIEGSSTLGYATINKFVDVFQVGDTIFDIRFEEYRKRGLYFQNRLKALDTEYNSYKGMNLSKDDQIELETRYLQQKSELYRADDNFIWGRPQDCGSAARYVVIDSKNRGLFHISQIVVINSAGQNVALSASVYQPLNMDYGSVNTDPRTKKYYDTQTGSELTGTTLTAAITAAENDMRTSKEAMLMDGNLKRRYFPNTYRTSATIPSRTGSSSPAPYSPLILDLGQTHNISVVQIILPMDVTGAAADMYTVQLKTLTPTTGGSSAVTMGSSGSDSSGTLENTDGTLTFRYRGAGDDAATCPYEIWTRFKVARFYTNYTASPAAGSSPWTVTGYSKGADAALTFDPKYNAGLFVDTTKNGGNLQPAYSPNVTYSLNMGGSPPALLCSDPAQIKRVFNEYNILVNSETFRYNTRSKTATINVPGETYTATKVTHARQDGDKCFYLWKDKVVSNAASGSIPEKNRQGTFPYPFDMENLGAYERVLDISGIIISDYTTVPAGMQPLGCSGGTSSGTCLGIEIPEMYMKSVTLDAAGGFCPALQCSDTEVMNSLINFYNTSVAKGLRGTGSGTGSGTGMPAISRIHKAITSTSAQCEFLVETVGGTGTRKVQFRNILVRPPMTNGNEFCEWVPRSFVWDNAPNMVDSVPYLTRMYNYAVDIMRPFSNNVNAIVTELTGMGSAQLDPAGSGIMNALVQYRTDTVAAAGDIRYFQNVADEFGNKCGVRNCKSPSVLNSLYNYYARNSGSSSGSSNSKLGQILRAGMTDDEQYCDFSFTVDNYNYAVGTSLPPVGPSNSITSGLRCKTNRIPFSCNFAITTCSYINPTPSLTDIEAIPNKFVQSLWTGSGSDPTLPTGSGPSDITTAPSAASGSQSLAQPPNGRKLLRSIDYIDCGSRYAKAGELASVITSNISFTQCSYRVTTGTPPSTATYNKTFVKVPGSLMLVPSGGWATGTIPNGIALLAAAPPVSTVQALVPYTIVSSAGATTAPANTFEYRITTENTLEFGETFIRAGFYTETDGSTQLAYLVPADIATSPNAFLATSQNFVALANQFRTYWNGEFVKNKMVGNKIGTIAGYYMNRAEDSITFVANSATFGPLGKYDVQKYYSAALYKVFFRTPYATGTGTSPFIYKLSPLTSGTIQESTGTSGTMVPLSTGSAGSDPSSDYQMKTPQQIMNMGLFRSFKFTVTAVAQDGIAAGSPARTRAEISRIYFYSGSPSGGSGGSSYSFTQISARNAIVRLEGVYANYTTALGGSCGPQYTAEERTTGAGETVTECRVKPGANPSYIPPANVACGIGYFKDDSNNCVSSGYFQEVLNPAMITTNKYVPRLRLDVGKSMTVDFNEITQVNTFSFILGSSFNRPLRWTLQGSINNIDWMNLHVQNTDFPYGTTVTAGKATSFFNPGYFLFSFSASGSLSNQRNPATQLAQYMQQGSTETVEGFKGPEPTKPRMRTLRWKILETQRPNAPYVHVSTLRFFTGAGPVPTAAVKITNPHGSRRTAADGPAALLSDKEGARWVDYNKSELLITFDLAKLPSNLINGFQFAVPSGITDSKEYFPARWLLEGSYDGRNWIPLHKKSDKARILGEASPVYKFSQSI